VTSGLDELLKALAETAVERDHAGGHAGPEKERLRQHGLLLLSVPRAHGGLGADWASILHIVRRVARVDSAMAHLLAFQHLQISGVLAYGSPAQQQRLLARTVRDHLWWGNTANPADPRLRATEVDGGLQLDGVKGFCSGTRGSQWLLTTAIHEPSGQMLIAVLPTDSAGISVQDDWYPVGQRQTDSTSVTFTGVRLGWENVLHLPGAASSPFLSLRGLLAQLILVNIYLGLAEGALAEARQYTLHESRPWAAAGVARAADDPYTLHRYAEMRLAVVSAAALADASARQLDQAWQRGPALTAQERGEVALSSAEAKVLAHRASLRVGEGVFDVCGARSARAATGLDRFWRNARTHTLHDPIDYKLRDIGRYAIDGQWPEPTLYS
jgi:alkylation response protein AidB-like acyl-CoA dehydrogenase